MTYQPQVRLSCNDCKLEFELNLRISISIFRSDSPDLLTAFDSAEEHRKTVPGHHSFRAELKSTGDIFEINLSELPLGAEGRFGGIEGL